MGRGILDYGLIRTEQIQLEQRTSDPSNPEPNEEWLRVDIKPTYTDANGDEQTGVAQYRVANADGSVSTAPVAQVGEATESYVVDKRRAFVDAGGSPTGVGFIPYAREASGEAAYPKRRMEHPTEGRLQMHNAIAEPAIPDSVVAQYDARKLTATDGDTVSTFTDSVNSNDATGGAATYRESAINGNPALEFAGSTSYTVSDGDWTDLSQPLTVIAVVNRPSDETNTRAIVGMSNSTSMLRLQHGGSSAGTPGWRYYAGNNFVGGSTDSSVQVVTAYFDGSNSQLREDGTQTATGNPGNDPINELLIGEAESDQQWFGDIGFIEIHDGEPSKGLATREQEVINDWNSTSDTSTFTVTSESTVVDTSDWAGRPNIAELADGTWVATYREAPNHGQSDSSEIHIMFSDDQGASWSAPNTYLDGTSIAMFPFSRSGVGMKIGYPFVAPNGDLLVHMGQGTTDNTGFLGTRQLRSTDGGETWTDEGDVDWGGTTNDDGIYTQDIAYNPDTGELVVAVFEDPNNDGGSPWKVWWATSSDNGSAWALENVILDSTNDSSIGLEAGIEYLGNSEYIVVCRSSDDSATYQTRSTDGGGTWSAKSDVSGTLGVIHKPVLRNDGALDYWYDGDYLTGDLYLSGRVLDGSDYPALTKSADGGGSWATPTTATGGGDAGYTGVLRRSSTEIYQLTYRGSGHLSDCDIVDAVYEES